MATGWTDVFGFLEPWLPESAVKAKSLGRMYEAGQHALCIYECPRWMATASIERAAKIPALNRQTAYIGARLSSVVGSCPIDDPDARQVLQRLVQLDYEVVRDTRNRLAHPPGDDLAKVKNPPRRPELVLLDPPDAVAQAWAVGCVFAVYRVALLLAFTVSRGGLALPRAFAPRSPSAVGTVAGGALSPHRRDVQDSGPTDETDPVARYRGMYLPVAKFLRQVPPQTSELTVPCHELDQLLDPESLPPAAHRWSTWWTDKGKPHTAAWREVGWTATLKRATDSVVFRRMC